MITREEFLTGPVLPGSQSASPLENDDVPRFKAAVFLGSATIPNKTIVNGTVVGGLSGLTRLPDGTYVAISDDKANARTYSLAIDLQDGRLDQGDVTVEGVTRLKNPAGYPFPVSDPESVVAAADGSFYIGSEGSFQAPFIKHFDATGTEIGTVALPPHLTGGYEFNRGIEALALTPDGRRLFAGTEHPLLQDMPSQFAGGLPSRIFAFDATDGSLDHEYVYTIDDFGADRRTDDNGLVELIALDDTHLLALERVFVSGRGNSIRLYEVDISGATDVAGLDRLSAAAGQVVPVKKTLLANLGFLPDFLAGTDALIYPNSPDNIEGMVLGPRLEDGRQSVILIADNNFRTDSRQITTVVALGLEPGANHAPTFSGLDATPHFVRGGAAVLLDTNATVADLELDRANAGHGDYRGSSLTIMRQGGSAAEDRFGAGGALGALIEGGDLLYDGAKVGTVARNSDGILTLDFDGNATSAVVDHVIQAITYANSGHGPAGTVTLDYRFDDGLVSSEGSHQVQVSTVYAPMHPGFSVASVNDWYNPAWGGGFNATFDYVVQAGDLTGGVAHAWEIAPNYHGDGTVTGAWVGGHSGPVAVVRDADDGLVLSTQGEAYKPALKAGDVIHYTVQISGAGFDKADFSSAFHDLDAPAATPQAMIDAHPTNDWGGGLTQSVSVHNTGTEAIDHWTTVLDVRDGIDVTVTSVWGANVSKTAAGDLVFEAVDWNTTIGVGSTATFGFNVTYHGAPDLSFADADFAFHQSSPVPAGYLLDA